VERPGARHARRSDGVAVKGRTVNPGRFDNPLRETTKGLLRPLLAFGAVRRLRKVIWEKQAQKAIAAYLASHAVRSLQIGCGFSILPGWLNMDLYPDGTSSSFLDATTPFPMADDCFDFIFSEHMIEHLAYAKARVMLQESFRVLKPGGVIRIGTPDLQKLAALCLRAPSEVECSWMQWQKELFGPDMPSCLAGHVVNNYLRAWQHTFIYDPETMREALHLAGFIDIRQCRLGESEHPSLQGIENAHRMPPGFLEFESMTFEATKPLAAL
jgi:predicted SAM-dependent methyltransferase